MSLKEDYLAFKQDMVNIANAIRNKKGVKRKMTLEDMEKVLEKDDRVLEVTYTTDYNEEDYELIKLINHTGYQGEEIEISFENYPAKCLKYQAFSPSSSSTASNISLTSLKLGTITKIESRACYNCINLVSVDAPQVEEIGDYAFYNGVINRKGALTTFNAPNLKKIGVMTFANYSLGYGYNFSSFDFTNMQEIGQMAFSYALFPEINAPKLIKLGAQAFERNTSLKKVKMDIIEEIPSGAFLSCTNLSEVEIPKVKKLNAQAFSSCSSLKQLILNKATFLGASSLPSELEELYLKGYDFCTSDSILYGKKVYVQNSLIDVYKTNGAWKNCTILPLPEEMSNEN